MATSHKYAYDREVRFKLELTQRRNTLVVTGELTAEGSRFLLDSGSGLLDSKQTDLVLDMRNVSASSKYFVSAVSWITRNAKERCKELIVLADGQIGEWLRDASIPGVQEKLLPVPEVACR